METKHTPGPWKHGTRERGRFCVYSEAHGRGICVMKNTQAHNPDHELNIIADANRDFIVTACNAHDELVEALEGIINCAGLGRLPGYEKEIDSAVKNAHKALANAKGE